MGGFRPIQLLRNLPITVTVGGFGIEPRGDLNAEGYVVTSLGEGDYSIKIRRARPGAVVVSSTTGTEPAAIQ